MQYFQIVLCVFMFISPFFLHASYSAVVRLSERQSLTVKVDKNGPYDSISTNLASVPYPALDSSEQVKYVCFNLPSQQCQESCKSACTCIAASCLVGCDKLKDCLDGICLRRKYFLIQRMRFDVAPMHPQSGSFS